METPAPQYTPAPQPKKSNTPLIIGIVVAVLLCCCCIIVLGVGLYLRSKVGDVYSSINEQLTAMPNVPPVPGETAEPSNPSDTPAIPAVPSDLVPKGGLGDDAARATAWGKVVLQSVTDGCAASDASKTTIDVTDQPDSSGKWTEKWTVTCSDGSNKSYNVTFTPNKAAGVPDIEVSESK